MVRSARVYKKPAILRDRETRGTAFRRPCCLASRAPSGAEILGGTRRDLRALARRLGCAPAAMRQLYLVHALIGDFEQGIGIVAIDRAHADPYADADD